MVCQLKAITKARLELGRAKKFVKKWLVVSARSLQRMKPIEWKGRWRGGEIYYYKELAHVVMENEKSQDLQPASWRSRRSNVEFQSESKSLRTGRANV